MGSMLYHNYNVFNIYNPANQTKSELLDNFVVRLREFEHLANQIKTDKMKGPPRHYLLLGQRGSGKTTLLLRLYHEIHDAPEVNEWLIPVRFDEEQYHIRTVCKLWENVVLQLEEERDEGFYGLYDRMQRHIDDSDYAQQCFLYLQDALHRQNKKLILFIDNFGDMLNKFERSEQQFLRNILTKENDIRIIGGSSFSLDYYAPLSQSLFDFFKVVYLNGLDHKETINLLLKLGEHYQFESIKEIVHNEPGRIESLRRLTGGVPRTIVLLFEIFVDNESGDSFRDLEIILDRVTPLYKHRMDDLSAQQQEIVHAMAMNWDAVGVKEISRAIHMESKAVSAQLKQLEENRIVTKIRTRIKNHFYQLTERFFNIWYLMRYGHRKERNKVLWLVRFLENWCSKDELIFRAEKHLQALKSGVLYEKHALYMTEALARTSIPDELQYNLIRETRKLLSEKNKDLIAELTKSDRELYNAFTHNYAEKKYQTALRNLLEIRSKTDFVDGMIGFLYEMYLNDFTKAEEYYLSATAKGNSRMLFNLANLYETGFKDLKKAESYYLQAYRKGYVNAIFRLGLMYEIQLKNYQKAMKCYTLAANKGNGDAMNNLALLYQKVFKDYSQAIHYYRLAVEAGHIQAMNNLAWLYFIKKMDKLEAWQLLQRAAGNDNMPVNDYVLTMILLWNNQFPEAQKRAREFITQEEILANFSAGIEPFLMLMMAKKQFDYLYHLFNENLSDIKDKYKPVYYALMYFMQDSIPDEYKRMGSELKQTVDEIIDQVYQMAIDYA
jgi:TPR repeat protein/DNA-binding transcriptional ArsR family regulator